MIRMIIYSGATVDDFTLKWIDNTTFSIRVRWQKFMQQFMMMRTNLDAYADVNGNLANKFPPNHDVYPFDMGRHAKKLKEYQMQKGCFPSSNPSAQNALIWNYLTLR